jgi:hypothetical protein
VIDAKNRAAAAWIEQTTVGSDARTGFAGRGLWSELRGMWLFANDAPVSINHEAVAAKLERREGKEAADEYRLRVGQFLETVGTPGPDEPDALTDF